MRLRKEAGISIEEKVIELENKHAPYIDFDSEEADIIVLAYQPGVGKTHNAIEYMKKKGNENTIYFTDRHEAIKERLKGWDPKNKPEPTHWKGSKHLCEKKDKKKLFERKLAASVVCKGCEKRSNKDCEYWKLN